MPRPYNSKDPLLSDVKAAEARFANAVRKATEAGRDPQVTLRLGLPIITIKPKAE